MFFITVYKMISLKESLMSEVSQPVSTSVNKVTIVGVGQVGMACAFSLLTQVCCANIKVLESKYCMTNRL